MITVWKWKSGFMKQNHKHTMYRNLMFGRYGILNLCYEKLHVKSEKSQYFNKSH